MKYLLVLLVAAVAVSADVREALRNAKRQAIIIQPQQLGLQLQRPQLQLVQQRQVQLVQQPQVQLVQQPQVQLVAQPVLLRQQPAFQTLQPVQTFQQRQPFWRILQHTQEFDPAGYYRVSYETENGIRAEEQGTVTNPGTNSESTAKQGNFAYTAPDGTPISLSYVADENGFRASGAHLPTPPPIPEAILKSLEQNAREEAQGGFNYENK